MPRDPVAPVRRMVSFSAGLYAASEMPRAGHDLSSPSSFEIMRFTVSWLDGFNLMSALLVAALFAFVEKTERSCEMEGFSNNVLSRTGFPRCF